MLIQLLVEREGDEHVLRVEGVRHTFRRNGYGHLVTEVTNPEHIKWMMRSTSYQVYSPPKIIHEEVRENLEEAAAVDPEPTSPVEESPAKPGLRKLRAPKRGKRQWT